MSTNERAATNDVDKDSQESGDASRARATSGAVGSGATSGPGLSLGTVTARALLKQLEETPGLIQDAVAAIQDGLKATSTKWSAKEKDNIDIPDYRARLDAAKLVFAYLEGLPLQRTLNMNVNKDDSGPPRLTPGILREMRAMLEAAERGEIPVDAEVTEKRG